MLFFILLKSMEAPIGIFDSGIGGLTVANAIRKKLPNESLVYFGDTAHLPYGDKSPELIRHYAARIAHFLSDQGCKMIVIACNTASSHAFQTVKDVVGPNVPVINVIDPVVNEVVDRYHGKKVGIIGTKGTVDSRIYPRRIKKADATVKVASLATPLLAPMIEEGFFRNSISQSIIHNYLEKKSLSEIQALILGCTHYPLIKREVKAFYDGKVEILDSPGIVASAIAKTLKEHQLESHRKADYRFIVSDKTSSFEKSTRIFFKERISLEELRIWD